MGVIGYGLGVIGAGIGIGLAAYGAATGMARQPEMQGRLFTVFILGAAFVEALALIGFVVAKTALLPSRLVPLPWLPPRSLLQRRTLIWVSAS